MPSAPAAKTLGTRDKTLAARTRQKAKGLKDSPMLANPAKPQSKYKPEYCELVVTWGRQGKSRMQCASLLNVSRETLTNWESQFPDFREALARAMAHSQNWWEGKAQQSLGKKQFQAQLWRYSMAGRFKEDYADNGSAAVNVTLDLGGAIAEIEARRRPSDAKPVEVASSFAPLPDATKAKE